MKNFFSIFLCFISIQIYAQTFVPVNGPFGEGWSITRWVHADDNMVYAAISNTLGGHTSLYKSDDYGETWMLHPSYPAGLGFTTMGEINGYTFFGSIDGDRLVKSNDNGANPEAANQNIISTLGYPTAIGSSENTLIIGGTHFAVRSTDNGATFENLTGVDGGYCYAAEYINNDFYLCRTVTTGPLANTFPIFKSSDEGATWEALPSAPSTTIAGYTIHHATYGLAELNGVLYAATDANNGGLFTSDDNGVTWTNAGNFITSFCVRNYDGILYISDYTGFHKSTDGGATWEIILDAGYTTTAYNGHIYKEGQYIYFGTARGPVRYTIATGELFYYPDNLTTLTSPNRLFKKDNLIMTVIDANFFISTDNGATWDDITDALPGFPYNIYEVNGIIYSAVLLPTGGGMKPYISTDQGQTWSLEDINSPEGFCESMFAYNPRFYATDSGWDTKIWKSTDDGQTWTETTLVNTANIFPGHGVSEFKKYGDLLIANTSGDNKRMFYSIDEGDTWTLLNNTSQVDAPISVMGFPDKLFRHKPSIGGQTGTIESRPSNSGWSPIHAGLPTNFMNQYEIRAMAQVGDRIYVQINPGSAFSDNSGGFYSIGENDDSWTFEEELGTVPYLMKKLEGTSASNMVLSTWGGGLYTTGAVTGVTEKNRNSGFNLFPNPSKGFVTIDSEMDRGMVKVTDLSGKEVMRSNFSSSRFTLALDKLESGLYIITLSNEQQVMTKKLILE